MQKISIVTTMYKSERYITEFYERIKKTIKKLDNIDYELIFVDDGSPDNSLQEAIKLYDKDSKVKVIQLSRNFGHHKAIMTGLSNATGDYIFLIDIDLEENPELLEDFWVELHKPENKDVDVIYGVQTKRKGNWFERWSGKWYYRLFNTLSDNAKISQNVTTIRLMTKNYIEQLLLFRESEFYFVPVCSLTGFKQKAVYITKNSYSPTTYSFFKKYHLLINSIITFSNKPLYFIFYSGLILTLLSFIFVIFFIYRKLIYGVDVSGWASLVISLWFLSGIIIMFLGIISIYISKIFIESKNRPFTVIKKIYQSEER